MWRNHPNQLTRNVHSGLQDELESRKKAESDISREEQFGTHDHSEPPVPGHENVHATANTHNPTAPRQAEQPDSHSGDNVSRDGVGDDRVLPTLNPKVEGEYRAINTLITSHNGHIRSSLWRVYNFEILACSEMKY